MNDARTPARWLVPAALLFLGTGVLAWSWLTWPDAFVDFGRELYVPWRLSQGARLYTDIAYFNGPLSPYWNALWFGLVGPGLLQLTAINIALAAVITGLLYRLLAAIGDRLSAAVACGAFVLLFACAQFVVIGNYNFVAPYSHELTHGILLSLVSIALLARHLERPHRGWLVASGLSLGLVFLTKPEVFVALSGALAGGLLAAGCCGTQERPWRAVTAQLALLLASASVPVALALAALALTIPPETALRGVVGAWPALIGGELSTLPFYRGVSGLADPARSVMAMLRWLGITAGALTACAALSVAVGRWRPQSRVLPFLVFGALLAALLPIAGEVRWLEAARPLPLLLLCAALVTTLQLWRGRRTAQGTEDRGERPSRLVLQLVVILFALLLLAKIALNVRVARYGFALAMPALTVSLVAVLAWLPRAVARAGGSAAAFRAAALALLAVALVGHLRIMDRWIAAKTHRVDRGVDAFATYESVGKPLDEVLAEIERLLGPEQRFVVLPEGVTLNYLARRASPTAYINFMPPEIYLFGEQNMLRALRQNPPDAVVLVHKNTSEYGLPLFGVHYGQKIMAWVKGRYRPVWLTGDPPLRPGSSFGIQILLPREDRRTR